MELKYNGKKTVSEILNTSSKSKFSKPYNNNNSIIYGDNFDALKIN